MWNLFEIFNRLLPADAANRPRDNFVAPISGSYAGRPSPIRQPALLSQSAGDLANVTLGNYFPHDTACDVGQAKISAGVAIRQTLVIEP